MSGGQRPADLTQDVLKRGGGEAAFQSRDQLIEQRIIRFREKILRLRCQLISKMGFARAPLDTALPDESVPFQTEQVRTHGIVC